MRYKLENGNLVPVTFIVTSEYVISNLTDEMIDSYKGTEGKPLNDNISPPIITDKQYLKAVYTETDTEIIKEYEVCEIIPSEIDNLKDDIEDANNLLLEIDFRVMLNENGLSGLEPVQS